MEGRPVVQPTRADPVSSVVPQTERIHCSATRRRPYGTSGRRESTSARRHATLFPPKLDAVPLRKIVVPSSNSIVRTSRYRPRRFLGWFIAHRTWIPRETTWVRRDAMSFQLYATWVRGSESPYHTTDESFRADPTWVAGKIHLRVSRVTRPLDLPQDAETQRVKRRAHRARRERFGGVAKRRAPACRAGRPPNRSPPCL